MQFKLAAFTTLVAAATLAAASATPAKRFDAPEPPKVQCNIGQLTCCESFQPATSQQVANLLGPLGFVLGSLTGLVGITCNPVGGIAINGNSCSAQPTCCEDNSFNGVFALGCNPINGNA